MGSQLVKLTWRDKKKVKVEVCELLDPEATFYTFEGEEILTDLSNIFAKEGYVMFEDYEGVFGLKPEQIISIEPIKK